MSKNPKMVMCRNCNTVIAANAKVCPACGAKNKKPFYTKWWFIIIVIIVVLRLITLMGRNHGEEFAWNDIELGEQLPAPKSNVGEIISNADDHLNMYVYKTSSGDYKDYIKACEDDGYVIESDKRESGYDAYNSAGYKLSLGYDDNKEKLSIILNAPEEMKEFSWATAGIGSMLPIPKSNMGKITTDSSDTYIVRVGNTSKDDYAEYVKACEDAGFIVDYNKYDESYSASNEDGYHLRIQYVGFNTMEVSIKAPEEVKTTEIPESSDDKVNTDNQTDNETNNNTDSNVTSNETIETKESNTGLVDGMRPEFKEAMDSYEAYYRDYCDILKKYTSDPTDLSILTKYTELMDKSAEMSEKFDAWDEGEMNNAELKYYLEVSGRVTQMLLEIGQ